MSQDKRTDRRKFIAGIGGLSAATLEQTATIALPAGPSYVTPDPNGKYVYASVKGTLVVIDTTRFRL